MKFTLVYEGELRSNDGAKRKWDIRKHLHPQLQELWKVNGTLKNLRTQHRIPEAGCYHVEKHHSLPEGPLAPITGGAIDLLEPVKRGNRLFFPLVRDSLALQCGVKILFLRKEEPGRVYQGGDLDSRIKTLFDALSAPNIDQVVPDESVEDPIFCLLEDDSLIRRVDVTTDRLLSRPSASKHDVQLIIEVDVRPTQSRIYNQAFLGD